VVNKNRDRLSGTECFSRFLLRPMALPLLQLFWTWTATSPALPHPLNPRLQLQPAPSSWRLLWHHRVRIGWSCPVPSHHLGTTLPPQPPGALAPNQVCREVVIVPFLPWESQGLSELMWQLPESVAKTHLPDLALGHWLAIFRAGSHVGKCHAEVPWQVGGHGCSPEREQQLLRGCCVGARLPGEGRAQVGSLREATHWTHRTAKVGETFVTVTNSWENNLKGGRAYFGSQFQRFQSIVLWLHYFCLW
jgi:hypothetical protein